jgi:phage-related protein
VQIQPALSAIGQLLGGVLIVALGLLIGLITGLASAVANSIGGIIQIFTGLIQFLSGAFQFVGGIVMLLVHLFTGNFDALGKDLANIWGGIVNMFQGAWTAVGGVFMTAIGFVTGLVGGFVGGVVGWFTGMWQTITGKTLPGFWQGIVDFFTQLPGKAVEWGRGLIQGFVNGINNMVGAVAGAVGGIIDTVKGWLGFHSPTEKGPGRDIEKWPRAMVRTYAEGINAMSPLIESSVRHMIDPINMLNSGAEPQLSLVSPGRSEQLKNSALNQMLFLTIQTVVDGEVVHETNETYQLEDLMKKGAGRR